MVLVVKRVVVVEPFVALVAGDASSMESVGDLFCCMGQLFAGFDLINHQQNICAHIDSDLPCWSFEMAADMRREFLIAFWCLFWSVS